MKTVWRVKKDGAYIHINKKEEYSFESDGDNRIATLSFKKAFEVCKKYGGKVEKGIG